MISESDLLFIEPRGHAASSPLIDDLSGTSELVRSRRVGRKRFATGFLTVALAALSIAANSPAQQGACQVEITVIDKETGKPAPCRITLENACGVPERAGTQLLWRDHLICICDGVARLTLQPGRYAYEIERGPEYLPRSGMVNTFPGDTESKLTLTLERMADLATEGWWSGDLHIHRPLADIERLMLAEDLHVASVITWWNKQNLWTEGGPPARFVCFDVNRYYHGMGGEDERGGGSLLYAKLPRPLAIAAADGEYPSSLKFAAAAGKFAGAWVDMEKPYGWDAPLWLASGQVNSAGLANANMCRDGMYRGGEEPGNCKPRNLARLPPPLGNGYWTLETYYHMLNCGLRIPPSAGSAFGGMPNPVGYNRVYVHVEGEFSYDKWWEGLRAGCSFVTNGPLLRARAAAQLPGHVFRASEGDAVSLEVTVQLSSRDPIRAIEIVKNGQVERAVPPAEATRSGSLGRVRFQESGWFVVRAIAEHAKTFRFAQTAPYYVEIGNNKRRVSEASVRFFRDWTAERSRQLERLGNPVHRQEVLEAWEGAKKFWEERLAQANAP
jgi:hypothetical protein